jgi:agmatine deiminase
MSLGFRMPAEWEPHAATWLAWPHNLDTWPGNFAPVPATYVAMVRTLCTSERVNVCVNDADAAACVRQLLIRADVNLSKVALYEIPTNDAWARDHGPIFLTRTNNGRKELAVTDWIFNSWGEKYGPWDLDDIVPRNWKVVQSTLMAAVLCSPLKPVC